LRKFYDEIAEILDIKEVAENIFLIKLTSEYVSSLCSPGQFINIRLKHTEFPFLRRPFSIYNAHKADKYVEILIKIVGKGTEALCHSKKGEKADVLGPLGNTFNFSNYNHIILVAGGIGIPPLYFIYNKIKDQNLKFTFLYGARSKSDLIENKFLGIPEKNLIISTDDGSHGIKGTIIDVLEKELQSRKLLKPVKILGCGPDKMLEKLDYLAQKHSIDTELSVESIMGCGFGVCQGCAIKVKNSDGFSYKLVCKDGPVFNSNTIIWK